MTVEGEGPAGKSAAALPPRRLATIVSIDAAGYSHQSEVDEATAVREITALGERIRASAASRGGRVFNTAGDGFMLEFPSASAAVAAAEELQASNRVPLRMGVHVGEIHETPTGDLLGKGVNIAARLMQSAPPGAIAISGDAKRALSTDIAERLQRRGVVRLDKMEERIEVYALGSPWVKPRTPPLRFVFIGAGAVALALAAWFGSQALLRPSSQAVAVLEFRTLEPGLESFATGLADRLIGTMSTHDLQPAHTMALANEDRVATAFATGAAFVLDGTVRPEGNDLLVTSRLIDRRGNVAIWSSEYRRAASEQEYLQEQIGADVTHVLRCALMGAGRRSGDIDPAALSVFLRACDRADEVALQPDETIGILRQVTEQAPRFSRGWSARAIAAAYMASFGASDEVKEAARAEAEDSIARARRLDRNNGESYLAEALLLPNRDWRGRQVLIERAIAVEPDLAAAHVAHSLWLMETGRTREALPAARRAAALEPLNPDHWANLSPILSTNGFQEEADELRTRLYRLWPDSDLAWYNRFANAAYNSDPSEALQMLEDLDNAPAPMHPLAVQRWRGFLQARESGDPRRLRTAAHAMRDLIPGKASRYSVGAALSLAGEVDAAIEIAQGALNVGYSAGALALPPWRNVRRDPRYMMLMKDTGLIQFWQESGRWPDVCGEPDWPYDCAAEAARALRS